MYGKDALMDQPYRSGRPFVSSSLHQFRLSRQQLFFWTVFLLLPAALACDVLDGFVAPRTGLLSPLGSDLDSLADVVSFGVAPAALGFTLGLRSLLDGLILKDAGAVVATAKSSTFTITGP